jgi:hypothetical protein
LHPQIFNTLQNNGLKEVSNNVHPAKGEISRGSRRYNNAPIGRGFKRWLSDNFESQYSWQKTSI